MAPPLDPRLLRQVAAARRWVILAALLQTAVAGALVIQAVVLADVLTGIVIEGAQASTVTVPVLVLCAVLGVRVLIGWAQERYAHRAAAGTLCDLRERVLDRITQLGPAALDGADGAAVTTLLTRGLDALDAYLMRYLPQLLATALVTPALVVVVATKDLGSALVMVLTLPMVPVFMALVGWATEAFSKARLARMQQLGTRVLDLVAGIGTLRALGRAGRQAARVAETGEAYRKATNTVLRRAFLSGLVLEIFTTLSVAIVAVIIGFRLLGGSLDLRTGLAVLILAPEVYLPLRMVGLHYHASADGVAAAGAALDVLERPVTRPHGDTPPPPRVERITWDGVAVAHTGRDELAPYGLDAVAVTGQVTALVGPNGGGKTTAIYAALGLRGLAGGRILLHGSDSTDDETDSAAVDLTEVDLQAWHRQIAWAPQSPVIVPGTLRDNALAFTPGATGAELRSAARRVGLDQALNELPAGWDTPVAAGGLGLSAGQRQRLALCRVLLAVGRGAHVVVLDEPTSHLDAGTERILLATVRELADEGALVLLAAHRDALTGIADRTFTVSAQPVETGDAA